MIRAVRDAVEYVVPTARCARVIERALARDGLSQVPDNLEGLEAWLRTSLTREVRDAAGDHAAHVLTLYLTSLLGNLDGAHVALSRQGVSTRPKRATRPGGHSAPVESLASASSFEDAVAPPHLITDDLELCEEQDPMDQTQPDIAAGLVDAALGHLPSDPIPLLHKHVTSPEVDHLPHVRCRVMIASSDSQAVHGLQQRLGEALHIEHVEQIVQLMDIAPNTKDERVALLLDCRKPTMHPASVAGLADELPYGWWIIAWGIDTLTWEELEPDRQGPLHWVRCAPEASWNDVIGLSSTLLAAGS